MRGSWREAAIAESKTWLTTCRNCGAHSNVWAHGAMRSKAHGSQVLRTRFPGCGKFAGHDVRRDQA